MRLFKQVAQKEYDAPPYNKGSGASTGKLKQIFNHRDNSAAIAPRPYKPYRHTGNTTGAPQALSRRLVSVNQAPLKT
jgi:hypothetical protein